MAIIKIIVFALLLFAPFSALGLLSTTVVDDSRVIDWTTTGVSGGIPTDRTQSGSTILASTYNDGTDDATSGIQSALNGASSGTYVLLGAGIFRINTYLTIPSNVTLRGDGQDSTYLYLYATSGTTVIGMGSTPTVSSGSATNINSGGTKGSTEIVVASASGFDVGDLLYITGLNDTNVTATGQGGLCNWCGPTYTDETRLRSQITKISSVNGTTIGLEIPLYHTYDTPTAIPFAASTVRAGLEDLTLYGTNTGFKKFFHMGGCDQCWINNVEGDFSDDYIGDIEYSYRCEIRKSNFHDSFSTHTSGNDQALVISSSTSHMRIENNIFGRHHTSIILRMSSSGNAIAYNYFYGSFDNVNAGNYLILMQVVSEHGAHPHAQLFEGNIGPKFNSDSYWGSGSNPTYYRNWATTYTDVYSPFVTRGAPSVYYTPWKVNWGFAIEYLVFNANMLGNISGSDTTVSELAGTEYGWTEYPTARNGFSTNEDSWNFCIGYNISTSGGAASPSQETIWNHGNYSHAGAAIVQWEADTTHTLPSSFIHNSKPIWFGNINWPPIGPDISTGISDSDGYANKIPAQIFYETGSWPSESTPSIIKKIMTFFRRLRG